MRGARTVEAPEVVDVDDAVLRPPALAMVWTGGGDFVPVAVPGVRLGGGDALIAVELVTIAPRDVSALEGRRSQPGPVCLGHEVVGRVVRSGPSARDVLGARIRVGDRVVMGRVAPCRRCRRCRRAERSQCVAPRLYGSTPVRRGWELNGGFATHVHVLAGSPVARVADDVPAAALTTVGEEGAVAAAALRLIAAVEGPPGVLVVSGNGVDALATVAFAGEAGWTVVHVDGSPDARRRARAFGAAVSVAPGDSTGAVSLAVSRGADRRVVGVDLAGGEVWPLAPQGPAGRPLTRGDAAPSARDVAVAAESVTHTWRSRPWASLVTTVMPLGGLADAVALAGDPGGRIALSPHLR